MFRYFLNLSISIKLIALLIAVTALFMGAILIEYLPAFERELLKDRRNSLRYMIDVTYSLLDEYHHRVEEGEFSKEEAQKRALTRISHLFYGNNDYFWINDSSLPYPTMIMHPMMPDLNGEVLDNEKFKHAGRIQFGLDGRTEIIPKEDKNLFQAIAEVAHESKEGYITYLWPKPTENGLERGALSERIICKTFRTLGMDYRHRHLY